MEAKTLRNIYWYRVGSFHFLWGTQAIAGTVLHSLKLQAQTGWQEEAEIVRLPSLCLKALFNTECFGIIPLQLLPNGHIFLISEM